MGHLIPPPVGNQKTDTTAPDALVAKLQHAPKYQDRPHAPGKELVSGESALYLGREYRITLTSDSERGVVFDRAFLIPQGDRLQTRHAF